MTTRRFDVLAVGSPLHDAAALRRALEPSLRALAALGGRETGQDALGPADPLAVVVGTGGTEAEILRLHGARQADLARGPAPPRHASPRTTRCRRPSRRSPGSARTGPAAASSTCPGRTTLRRSRGSRPRSTTCAPSGGSTGAGSASSAPRPTGSSRASRPPRRCGEVGVPRRWRSISTASSTRRARPRTSGPSRSPRRSARGRRRRASPTPPPCARRRPSSGARGPHGRRTPRRGRRPLLRPRHAPRHARLPRPLGAERRRPVAACEGDLASAVGMLWVKELLGTASWMANPVPRRPRLRPPAPRPLHRRALARDGLGAAVPLRVGTRRRHRGRPAAGPGHAPAPRGTGLEQAFLAEGEAVAAPRREDLCRTQVDVTLAPGEVTELLERPLGNHLLLVPGHHAARLRDYWDWAVAT